MKPWAAAVLAFQLAACNAAVPAKLPAGDTEIGAVARDCSAPRYCGKVGFVDCGAAWDGPAYYFEKDTGKILGRCGGDCIGPVGPDGADPARDCATSCPPPAWKCSR
ncbi:hypothetical protein [Caulobacter sp. 17J80-11]|uniref:hypothetical protein n=1 Tax=Caulobacter sp. 17J80-11 TaxID=2763502 RepID=UPI001653C654|nr:hypothetical protein [Caulobacter sp. 17J80-11]MBC6981382.1 hypothetical protein [Caulobacter sp. 17J80-11]